LNDGFLAGCQPYAPFSCALLSFHSAYFHYWTANQWVTACLEVMGAFIVLAVAMLGVYAHHEVCVLCTVRLGYGAGVSIPLAQLKQSAPSLR
jgi:hypothetical protein